MSALLCAVAALAFSPSGSEIQAVKFQLAESFRSEFKSVTRVHSGGSSTSSGSTSSGQASFDLTLKGYFAHLTRETLIKVSLGDLEFSRTLGSDPDFKDDSRRAELKEFVDPSGQVKVVSSSLKLTWTSSHLTMKFLGVNRSGTSLVARSVLNQVQDPGDFNGDAKLIGSIGGTAFEAPFSFSGRLDVTEAGDDLVQTRISSILLKGRLQI